MATPTNPLDVFVTYTTHFELHATAAFDELKELASFDANLRTTPKETTDTLVINTRRDAHQMIDNVRFQMINNSGDPTASMVAVGNLTMDVTEPNGASFIEKIKRHAEKLAVTGLTDSLIFGLKIIFVGRKKDNTVETIPLPYIIPMQLTGMGARFDFKGGEYKMEFIISGSAGVPSDRNTGLGLKYGFVNSNITIKAKTVKEALSQLEEKLNHHYDKTYSTELRNNSGARSIKYKINNMLDLDGELDKVSTDSYREGDYVRMTFPRTYDLVTMARNIIYSSKALCDVIGESTAGLKQELHPGVKVPTFTPRYHLKNGELELGLDIQFYTGGGSQYTFDYLFSDPGKNVDVMDFEIKMANLNIQLSASKYGFDSNINLSNEQQTVDPSNFSNNVLTPNTTRDTLKQEPSEPKAVDLRRNDVAALPTRSSKEVEGVASLKSSTLPSYRLAFEALTQLASATEQQTTFTIRGHLDILKQCVVYPDGSIFNFGASEGMWIKVNIKDYEGNPFYYTGYYFVNTVDNIFSQGKFIQMITVMQMAKPDNSVLK